MTLSNTGWQDYRGKAEGVLIHTSSSKQHELPVREIIDVNGQPVLEPNYESGTYGVIQCLEARTRASAFKARRRYFLFGTRYQGTREEFRGRFFIIGYMRLEKALDVRKRHSFKWMEESDSPPPECMEMDACFAYQSSEMNFYAIENCFELSEALMQEWGYKGKITKQMKLTFTEDKIDLILGHFKDKTPRNADYQEAVKALEAEEEAKPKAEAW